MAEVETYKANDVSERYAELQREAKALRTSFDAKEDELDKVQEAFDYSQSDLNDTEG